LRTFHVASDSLRQRLPEGNVRGSSRCWAGRVKSCDEECKIALSRHRFPAAVIGFAVRWYFRFQLSLRDIEELFFERGVIVIVSVKPEESGWRQQI
jgi:hypothetical protein